MAKRERADGDEVVQEEDQKRARQDETSAGAHVKEEEQAGPGPGSEALDDEDDDHILLPKSTSRAAVKKGNECPYLDTVSRQVHGAECMQHACTMHQRMQDVSS